MQLSFAINLVYLTAIKIQGLYFHGTRGIYEINYKTQLHRPKGGHEKKNHYFLSAA